MRSERGTMLALVLLAACGQEPAPVVTVPAPPAPADAPAAEPMAEPPAPAAPVPAEPEPAADGAELARAVAQLFEQRCHECHGTGKRPKGGLRLTDVPALLARPAEEALIVAGDAEKSPLFQRLALPAEHEDVMPPEDGPLAAEELALVRDWIEAGAPWSAAVEAAQPRAAPVPAEPIAPLTPEQRGARDVALARLVERGAHAARLSAESDAVAVDLGVALPLATGADMALLAGLEPCLVDLSLARAPLAGADLDHLASFGELRRLRLDHVPIGDAGLARLAVLTKLESLNLYGARITAAGLASLAPLQALQRLYLGGNGLAPEALAEFERVLPGCALFGDDPR